MNQDKNVFRPGIVTENFYSVTVLWVQGRAKVSILKTCMKDKKLGVRSFSGFICLK
jgi:hypothetical protein